MSKVSLKSLAQQLNLSEGTVSRAINNYPDISEKTRKRVQTAAQEIGYIPNSVARRLAKGHPECIGYILPWQAGNIAEPFLGELLHGLSDAVSAHHWDLSISVAKSAQEELSIIKRLSDTGKVSGVVVSRTLCRDPRIDFLKNLKIPFVSHGRTHQGNEHSWFDIDNFAAFQEAVTHLVCLGHRKIAHIHGPLEYNFASERFAGYRQALLDHGLDVSPSLEVQSDMTSGGGYRAAKMLLAQRERPTALTCVSDMVAVGALKAVREAGLVVGKEISIIGYDGLPIGADMSPALTTMAQPLQDAGRKIGEMLIAVIGGDKPENNQELWRANLVCRETDGPPQ